MNNRVITTCIAAIALLRIWVAYALPITLDEAYYAQWARHLSWGYLDHPPGAAFAALLTNVWPQNTLAARGGALLAGLLTLLVALRTTKLLGIENRSTKLAVVLLLGLNIAAIGAGILTTPDTLLALFWTCAVHEALAALKNPNRWITFGLAIGAGLLSKYIMVLFVPPLLWTLWRSQRRVLMSKEFFAGVIVACCVIAPHIGWNAQNDWATVRFQLKRGFTASHGIAMQDADIYPASSKASIGSPEWQLSDFFAPDPAEEKLRVPPTAIEKFFQRTSGYALGLAALWGFMLWPILQAWGQRDRSDALPMRLLRALTIFPIVFFGVIALATPIEANWPAVYVVSFALWLAPAVARHMHALCITAVLNALPLVLLAALPASGEAPYASRNRLSKETFDYQQLSKRLNEQHSQIYASTYQITSMTRFYFPQSKIDQWPGLARRSELTRNQLMSEVGAPKAAEFWLVTEDRMAPAISGYELKELKELRLCAGQGFIETTAMTTKTAYFRSPCTAKTLARWFLKHYQPLR